MKKSTILIITKILATLLALFLVYYLIKRLTGLNQVIEFFSEAEKVKTYVLQFGTLAPLIFFLIQVLQVIFSPIPGQITQVVGGNLFGLLEGLFLSYSAIISGSIIAFLLARVYGKPLVIRLVGKGVFNKYAGYFNEKYIITLFLIFLFPFFPDDALCLLAGISTLPFHIFIALILLGRLPGVLVATLVGANLIELNPLSWAILIVLSIVIIILVLKYHQEIEDWLYRRIAQENKREQAKK